MFAVKNGAIFVIAPFPFRLLCGNPRGFPVI